MDPIKKNRNQDNKSIVRDSIARSSEYRSRSFTTTVGMSFETQQQKQWAKQLSRSVCGIDVVSLSATTVALQVAVVTPN